MKAAHAALKGWAAPANFASLVTGLRAAMQSRTLRLLTVAYSDISVEDVSKELGVSEPEAVALAEKINWVPKDKRFGKYAAPASDRGYSIGALAGLSANALFLETSGQVH